MSNDMQFYWKYKCKYNQMLKTTTENNTHKLREYNFLTEYLEIQRLYQI